MFEIVSESTSSFKLLQTDKQSQMKLLRWVRGTDSENFKILSTKQNSSGN